MRLSRHFTLPSISSAYAGARNGIVKICLPSTACTQYLPLVLNQPGSTIVWAHTPFSRTRPIVVTTAKGVGVGRLITAGVIGGPRFSLQAAPWTIKTATALDQITPTGGPPRIMTSWVARGWAHAPVSTTTSMGQPSGVVQLVTPSQVVTNLFLGSNQVMGSFVIAVIHFIPEPGVLLLLGSGMAGLVLLGRHRMRE